MHIFRRSVLSVVALIVAMGFSVATPATAHAWGSNAGCASSEMDYQSNTWGFFAFHKIRVEETACRRIASSPASFMWLKYVKPPRITFPTRYIWPTSESVELTNDPDVTKVYYNSWGKPYQVRYSFSAKSCSLHAICQDWDFYYYVGWHSTKICGVGGSCDDAKKW